MKALDPLHPAVIIARLLEGLLTRYRCLRACYALRRYCSEPQGLLYPSALLGEELVGMLSPYL